MANEAQADHADSELRELGFDPAAPPEQALETLRALSDRPGANEAAIARALGRIKIAGAADLLAAMEHRASGAARREIRRSLFRLRRFGLESAPAPSPPAQSKPAAASEPEGISALLSPFDHSGARLIWIMKPRVQGGLSHLTGVTSESEGLIGAGITERSRRELRQKREEIERDFGFQMVEADWRLADFILCEAYSRTPAAGRREVGDFLARRAEITAEPPPGPDFVHPVYRECFLPNRSIRRWSCSRPAPSWSGNFRPRRSSHTSPRSPSFRAARWCSTRFSSRIASRRCSTRP